MLHKRCLGHHHQRSVVARSIADAGTKVVKRPKANGLSSVAVGLRKSCTGSDKMIADDDILHFSF